ncbi:similar to VPS54 [Actinidia rufa]|uniref:Similar to VPS54 n=1 Tax=Actinidia rufa TaxID=165716 RepID=A0A7J0DP96_9ERIC|nr:similar to VPS54 [Actinidia rufa]
MYYEKTQKLCLQPVMLLMEDGQKLLGIGGRLGYSIRGTLQSQAKTFVDFQHESHLAKIKAVLDQETWVEVDVPDVYQAILTSLFCSEPLTTGNVNDGQDNTGQVISLSEVLPNYNDNSDVVTCNYCSSEQ